MLHTSVRSIINADDVNATAKKNTILCEHQEIFFIKFVTQLFVIAFKLIVSLRQNYTRRYEIGKGWCTRSIDGLFELNRNVAQFWIMITVAKQSLGKIFVGQLQITIQQNANLLI